jgi:hypothetical protein
VLVYTGGELYMCWLIQESEYTGVGLYRCRIIMGWFIQVSDYTCVG